MKTKMEEYCGAYRRKVSNKHTIKRNYCCPLLIILWPACYGNFSLSMCSLLNEKCIDAARSTVLHNTRSSSQISFNAHSFQSIIISKRLMRWTWYLYIWAAQWICVIYLCWCHRDHFASAYTYAVVRWSYYSWLNCVSEQQQVCHHSQQHRAERTAKRIKYNRKKNIYLYCKWFVLCTCR